MLYNDNIFVIEKYIKRVVRENNDWLKCSSSYNNLEDILIVTFKNKLTYGFKTIAIYYKDFVNISIDELKKFVDETIEEVKSLQSFKELSKNSNISLIEYLTFKCINN